MSEHRPSIFIIDDDESVRRALRRLVRSVGWEAEAFATAEEFLERVLPVPDCLVLDVHLPGLSGLELHQQMQAEGRDVPVVFISAYADVQMREQALQKGALAFLEKPFEEGLLLEAVGRALS